VGLATAEETPFCFKKVSVFRVFGRVMVVVVVVVVVEG